MPDIEPYTVWYYNDKLGGWRGRYRFAITDWSKFWRARLGWFARANLLGMWTIERVLGGLTMQTLLVAEAGPIAEALQVVHYTCLKKWGVTLYRSREVFALDRDGHRVTIERVQSYGPLFRSEPPDHATAAAQPDVAGMVYDWMWFDRRLRQDTCALDADHLELMQTCDYCRGEVVLERSGT